MPRKQTTQDGPNLFDLLDEIENGPPPCNHAAAVGRGGGWVHETNPKSDYYLEWVDANPTCRRSAFPGKHKTPLPKMGWSRKLQKDIPL